VQTVLPLDDTHAIKLTTALYHTPSGRIIQNQGITPDIIVDNLKIAQNGEKIDNAMMAPIREFGLKGHLKGTNDATAGDSKTDNVGLAQSDFQLYEAVKVLKTMAMINQLSLPATVTQQAAVSAPKQVAKQP
jgi:carboxyl-terminal processing protease